MNWAMLKALSSSYMSCTIISVQTSRELWKVQIEGLLLLFYLIGV